MPNIGEYQVSEDVFRLNEQLCGIDKATSKPASKYRNIPTIYKGRQYDSAREANRARELDLLKQAGEVIAWFPQVSFDLPDSRYEADFVVIDKDWQVHVEDVKSEPTKTPVYRLKKKLFKKRYGREIEEIQ